VERICKQKISYQKVGQLFLVGLKFARKIKYSLIEKMAVDRPIIKLLPSSGTNIHLQSSDDVGTMQKFMPD
jgi:hypothetical protein